MAGAAGGFAGLGRGAVVVCGGMGLSSISRDKRCRNLPRISAKVLSGQVPPLGGRGLSVGPGELNSILVTFCRLISGLGADSFGRFLCSLIWNL